MKGIFALAACLVLTTSPALSDSYFSINNQTNIEVRVTVHSQNDFVRLGPADQGTVSVGATKQFHCRGGWYRSHADNCQVYFDDARAINKLWGTGRLDTGHTYVIKGHFSLDSLSRLQVQEAFTVTTQ